MSRAQRICEIFNYDPSRIHLRYEGGEEPTVTWETSIDGTRFRFTALFLPLEDHEEGNSDKIDIHILFLRRLPNETWTSHVVPSTQQMAFRVFTASVAFLRVIHQRYGHNAERLSFSADYTYPSRVTLYRRLAQVLSREFRARLEEVDSGTDVMFNLHLP